MCALIHEVARQEAQKILDSWADSEGQVRLVDASVSLDVETYFTSCDARLLGVVSKNAGERPRIVINYDIVKPKFRFVWAHMLGHVVERRKFSPESAYEFSELAHGSLYDVHEFFADEFAEALLVPESAIARLVTGRASQIDEIAKIFCVPRSAVEARLRRLNVI